MNLCHVWPIAGQPGRVGCLVCDTSWDASLGVTGCIDGKGTQTNTAPGMSVTVEPILQFFAYNHLPQHLQDVSKPFCDMAAKIVVDIPRNPERTVSLRKLLEAKDAAVRATLFK